MRLRDHRLLLPLALSLACDVGSDPESDAPHANVPSVPPDTVDRAQPAQRVMVLPAAAWLDRTDSPITPWCGAVLVAPDVVVTAARCLESKSTSHLQVGFGDIASAPYEVEEVVLQEDAKDLDPDHALAALRLDRPVRDVAPVDLALGRHALCDVTTVANRYVVRGDPGRRWLWRGCVARGALTATVDAPNCHGDMGAGAFAPDGSLLGIAVDAWSDGGCSLGHRLATVADNEAFFDLALDLSRPVA